MTKRVLKKDYLAAKKTVQIYEQQELERNRLATVYCSQCNGKVSVSECDMFHPYKMEESSGYPVNYRTWYYPYALTCMCGKTIETFKVIPDKYKFLRIIPLNKDEY